jgi:phage gp45-like
MMLANILRWVRVRGLREGRFQAGRVEGFEGDVRDDAQRPQDYGFAANPVDGEGLKLEVGGHTVIVRVDRSAERPQLPAYEVAVWHKEGHMVRLRAGRIVQVDCDEFVVNASTQVRLNTPMVTASQAIEAQAVAAASSLQVAGKEVNGHDHGNVQTGSDHTAAF